MHKLALFVFAIALVSFFSNSEGFIENEKIFPRPQITQSSELLQVPQEFFQDHRISRYLVFGPQDDIPMSNGLFSIITMQEQSATALGTKGYQIIRDLPLEFDANEYSSMNQIRKSIDSEAAYVKYNYTGSGIKIAIVDTGVDFSNPDLQGAVARDKYNRPIMLDADGQGLVLTNATFIANINKFGIIENTTKQIIDEKNKTLQNNATSTVYVTKNGVYLSLKKDKGTNIQVYNSFFPNTGPSPVFNATIIDDYKIGKSNRDFIKSASGVYHFGMVYQGAVSGPFASVQVVPVLVVDSVTPGLYDTIIPDMSTSYKDYTRFDLRPGQKPSYDFDFTDERPIRLGDGNEFLIYDSNKDGKPDYSAGTVGAQILDVHGVISQNKSAVDKILKATNGTLLPGLDPKGNFFGVMSDFVGHGTSSAGTISSSAKNQYDIYNNTKKYTLPGVAQGAKIIPIKALWFGDTLYAWMWAAGFDNINSTWHFTGEPRADIISNSWGISTFPSLKTVPGIDTMSLVSSVLSTPNSIDPRYPGLTIISSAGNAGHGYGTMGLPNASPFVITVGAVTNNVNVGYGAFKGQPRFGNTTIHANDIVDFSSRGPSVLGDPKPDIMGTGAYGFVPSNVINSKPSTKREPFTMYGGTSMAAPVVAGSAAILMESLKSQNQDYTPFTIKSMLMSTATDLANDPFTQGSGLVNPYRAVQLLRGEGGMFAVYNNSTYSNMKKILDVPLKTLNATAFGISNLSLPEKSQQQTSWFGGRIAPGEKSTTVFTIENPTNQTITVSIMPKSLQLVSESSLHSSTRLNLTDSIYNKPGTYRPDYIRLSEVKSGNLSSLFDENTIPDDSLLVLNLNFAFPDFMNKTEKQYAADMKIASLYLYDWNDKNKDQKISSDELSMVNRAGSWGTGQELRVTDPKSKFQHTPLVGVYAVPTKYSYWLGDTKKNATSMDYTITASYYKKQEWSSIWLDTGTVRVQPKSTSSVTATIIAPKSASPGLYQGFLEFSSANHTVNAPVSYAVTTPIPEREKTIVIPGSHGQIIYGNGYFKGAFDMVNRYNAGDWRQYYFEVQNPTVNIASIDISWKDPDTNLSVFVIDPQGRIVQTNAPPGAFGHFLDWPSSDWLGTTIFSEGGGFFPVKNKDATSSILLVPINQTGTYTLLLHNTLYGGSSKTEPFTVLARFSSLSKDDTPPQISADIPYYLNGQIPVPQITDESPTTAKYYIDDHMWNPGDFIPDGHHTLRIEATDNAGNISYKTVEFVMDRTPPKIIIQNNTITDGMVEFQVEEQNPATVSVTLADGQRLYNITRIMLPDIPGPQRVLVYASDLAGNYASTTAFFQIKTESIEVVPEPSRKEDSLPLLMAIGGAIAIGALSAILFVQKAKKH
ncbi:S8 family serine peptidase [Candidatus Nitrosotenuis uzonensis]|uniref:Peptidase S8 and S53 subtilisin kexin sedolisin n=1 Tax=Candidatus Nitrosotenuis uzonensis TaxID=1407055 RepID=V6AU67_9ARCH|nr:S8 family serine peptidase [Candidatus Nitrosotenuis uzonensis]CDI06306.1 Peptidase S8 and S53 subtilisin kexin sedolisin [Candidatus Nitrosotenuis uzonensis]